MSLFRVAVRNLVSLPIKNAKDLPLGRMISCNFIHTSAPSYEWNVAHLCLPKSLYNRLWRKVHYPEKYTIEPLRVSNLGGRDPDTG